MQLSQATEIIEAFGATRVNELLGEGWKILAVTTSSYGEPRKASVSHATPWANQSSRKCQ